MSLLIFVSPFTYLSFDHFKKIEDNCDMLISSSVLTPPYRLIMTISNKHQFYVWKVRTKNDISLQNTLKQCAQTGSRTKFDFSLDYRQLKHNLLPPTEHSF